MLKLAISTLLALVGASVDAAQGTGNNPVSVEIVATASEYVSRSTNISHPGHSYTNCSGNTSFFGQFHDYGNFGTFSGTADTRTRCSTSFSPPTDSAITTYRRLNYTIVKSDTALYLLSCTQIWKHTAKERALLGVMGGLEGSNGSSSENSDKVAANAKGEWSDCPAFILGSKYTLTVRKTSDARLDDGTGKKPAKLDYLGSGAIPTSVSHQEPEVVPSTTLEAKIHVTSDPTGGEIHIDGKFFGNAPSDLTLPVGEHVFKVVIGGKEWSRTVQITSGEITIHADLYVYSAIAPTHTDEKDGAARDAAVSQMRQIVDSIRSCPATSTVIAAAGAISHHTVAILDWNVIPADSLRSPFTGDVHFKVVNDLEETEEAKGSKPLSREYEQFAAAIVGRNFVEYRYEFALGTGEPELKRAMLFVPGKDKDFREYSAAKNGFCWDNIASSLE